FPTRRSSDLGRESLMAGEAAAPAGRRLASAGNLELLVPECARGLGSMIGAVDSPDLISGVRVLPLSIYPDDRGYFLEVHRMGCGLAAEFPATRSQISAAVNFPGTVKAFHSHLFQTDSWTPIKGLLQVALVDLRRGSS